MSATSPSASTPASATGPATSPAPTPVLAAGSPMALETLTELIGYDPADLEAAGVSLVLVDASVEGLPLSWVSPAFLRLTGYTEQDVLGFNCRFLQTEHTSDSARARIREALAAGEPVRETLLNRRADGSVFWNELLLAPIRHGGAQVTHFVGYQVDVTSRVSAHAAHDRFLEAEHRARTNARREQPDR